MPALRRFLPLAVLLMLGTIAPSVASAQTPAPSPTPSPVDMRGILGVTPSGTGGDTAYVEARNLPGDVLFGDQPAEIKSMVVALDVVTRLPKYFYTVVVPPGTPGTTVDVTINGIGGVTPTANDFTYDDAPPTEPLAWQCGDTFTVDVDAIPASLSIGGQSATFTTVDADTITIDAPSPAFSPGPDYGVVAPGGRTLGAYRNGCFSPLPRTGDTSLGIADVVSPAVGGFTAGGNRVVVKVYGESNVIDAAAQLLFDGKPGTNPTVSKNNIVCLAAVGFPCPGGNDGWLVSATAPAGTAGWVDLSVQSGAKRYWGQTAASNDYRYIAPPVIRSVTPARGPARGGNTVDILIDGDWIRNPVVAFGGVPTTYEPTYTRAGGVYDGTFDSERITAVVPAGVAAGTVDVTVSGPSNIGGAGVTHYAVGATPAADDYTYEAPTPPPPAPVITGHGGGPGFANVGGLLIVRGSNLGGLRSIKVGGRAALRLGATPTMIIAWAPPLAKGAYPVTVTTTAGTATAPVKYVYRSLF